MFYIIKSRWLFILFALTLIFLGLFMIISLFKLKQKNKLVKAFLLIIGLLSLSLGLYGLLFVFFFGVNT